MKGTNIEARQLRSRAVSILFLLLILAALGFFVRNNLDEFKALKLENGALIVPLAMIIALQRLSFGPLTLLLVKPLGVTLGILESFGIASITGFYNSITPFRGGVAARAIYLKKFHELDYAEFFSSLSGLFVVKYFTGSVLALISGLYTFETNTIGFSTMVIVLSSFVISLGLLILFTPVFKPSQNQLLNKIIRAVNGFHIIRRDNHSFFLAIGLSFIQILTTASAFIVGFHIFGYGLGALQATFLAGTNSISLLLGITPSGLGVTEFMFIFTSEFIALDPELSLAVAVLHRTISILVSIPLGLLFSYRLLKTISPLGLSEKHG